MRDPHKKKPLEGTPHKNPRLEGTLPENPGLRGRTDCYPYRRLSVLISVGGAPKNTAWIFPPKRCTPLLLLFILIWDGVGIGRQGEVQFSLSRRFVWDCC